MTRAYLPHGGEPWPETVVVPLWHPRDDHGVSDVCVLTRVMFTLVWYYNGKVLEGCHNIKTPPAVGYVSPAYDCPDCDKVMLVPLEVRNFDHLVRFLQDHMRGH